MNRSQPEKPVSSVARVAGLLASHLKPLAVGTIALLIGVAVNLSLPRVFGWIVERSAIDHLNWTSSVVVIALGLFTLQALAIYGRTQAFGLVGQRVVAALRANAYESILAQPIETFDRQRVGDLTARIQVDTGVLQQALTIHLPVVTRYGLQVIGGVVAMLSISLALTGAVLGALALVLGTSLFLARRLRTLSRTQQTVIGELSGMTEESLSAIRLVKAFGRERVELERFSAVNTRVLDAGISRLKTASFLQSFGSWLLNVVLTLIVLGAFLAAQTETGGTLIVADGSAFLLYGIIVGVSFALAAGGLTEFMQALGAVDRIFELQGDGNLPPPPPATQRAFRGEVNFESIHFAYPTRPESTVLRNFTLAVKAGTWLGVVGPSGSGKSTLGHLLLRFYEPGSGTIGFDGTPLHTIPVAELRRAIGAVSQEVYVFHLSLLDNLRLGNPLATPEEVSGVCEELGLMEWVRTLPQGLETVVGDRGVQMSGGQRQRLAIARVLLRNPELLILDEATSALDSASEERVVAAIRRRLQGRTVLIIAHRLASLRDVDTVAVLLEGRLVQSGAPSELRRQPGLFQTLWEAQQEH